MTYRAASIHGYVRDASTLFDAVAALGHALHIESCHVPIPLDDEPLDHVRRWALYRSASALEIDRQRGPITLQSPGWFAIVTWDGNP